MINEDQIQYMKEINYNETVHQVLGMFVANDFQPLSADWFEGDVETVFGDLIDSGWLEKKANGFYALTTKSHNVMTTIVSLRTLR